MTSVLVTGGCGFIASNFINIFHENFPDVTIVNLDKIDYCSNIHNVNPGSCVTVKGNIHNRELVRHLIEQYDFTTVFHFAAHSHVDNSFIDPLTFTMENAYGTHVLIETIRELRPTLEFIHFSTDEVYGPSLTDKPFDETTGVLNPTNPYSASKAAAEMIVNSYIKSFKMNIKIIRSNNVYGPNQYPEKIIPKFIKLVKSGKKCTLHGINNTLLKRAFIHADDVVEAVLTVWKNGKSGEVYNISSGYEITVMDVTKMIIEECTGSTDYDKWIEYIEDRPFNDERYLIKAEKLRALGWSQKKTLEDLRMYIRTYSVN